MATIKLPGPICEELCPDFRHAPHDPEVLKTVRYAAKALIEQAIDSGLPPACLPPDPAPGPAQPITFPSATSRVIRALAKQDAIREGDAALRFLYAALARGDAQLLPTSESSSILGPYLKSIGLQPRHPQDNFAKYLFEVLSGTGIGFVEAGTGIGKTLATIAVANELLCQRAYGRCVIAVPTLELVNQYMRQHEALRVAQGVKMVRARPVIGRSHFVDSDELTALAQSGFVEKKAADRALQWLADGAGPDPRDAGASCYLLSGLRAASPEFPIEAVGLRSDSDPRNSGALAYAAQFRCEGQQDDGPQAEIIYCTHAMLAADLRIRKRLAFGLEEGQEISQRTTAAFEQIRVQSNLYQLDKQQAHQKRKEASDSNTDELASLIEEHGLSKLPPWQHLVLDEAHLFETNLSGALSDTLSILKFMRNVDTLANAGLVSKAAATKVHAAVKFVRSGSATTESVDLTEQDELALQLCAALQEMHESVTTSLARSSKKQEGAGAKQLSSMVKSTLNQVRIQLNIMKSATRAQQAREMRAKLTYSPVREFPQMQVGRASVARELALMWRLAKSAACVSATLYLRRLDRDSARYMASILNTPHDRLQEYPTIRPTWSFTPVVGLWTAAAKTMRDGHMWLRPPTRSDRLGDDEHGATDVWLSEVGEALRYIHDTAAGGVLVLMTSYASAQSLGKLLEPHIPALVTARPGFQLASQVREFARLRAAGEKALWIAVGGAWTGLDVNGKDFGIEDPAQDDLMTDLVIPRIPFGLNRSITHKTRMEASPAIQWELQDTAMRFKQGLGRLVRREGLSHNRRFFVLDGRLNDQAFKGYLSSIDRLMSIYPRKVLDHQALNVETEV